MTEKAYIYVRTVPDGSGLGWLVHIPNIPAIDRIIVLAYMCKL